MIKRVHEAMSRLGAVLLECPQCQRAFNASKTPRYWITVLQDGDLLDNGDTGELCCSKECGDNYTQALRADLPKDSGMGFCVWKDTEREWKA
jgi:hypothetical protein